MNWQCIVGYLILGSVFGGALVSLRLLLGSWKSFLQSMLEILIGVTIAIGVCGTAFYLFEQGNCF